VKEWEDKPRVVLVAARDIKAMEVLHYDYGDNDVETVRDNPWLKHS
jgi:hypothetical protein